jgi:hypothetical protein
MDNNKEEELKKKLDKFNQEKLGNQTTDYNNQEMDCTSGVCIIKGDKSIVERINKKIITEDGRQLLF